MLVDILTWVLVGAIAGIIADWLIKGIDLGLIGKIIVGVLGGLLGGWLWGLLGLPNIGGEFLSNVITALVGAIILLLLLRLIRRRK